MASIKCGCCGETHTSVQEVKDCYTDVRIQLEEARSEAAAERANDHAMTFGSAYAQMASYQDYINN